MEHIRILMLDCQTKCEIHVISTKWGVPSTYIESEWQEVHVVVSLFESYSLLPKCQCCSPQELSQDDHTDSTSDNEIWFHSSLQKKKKSNTTTDYCWKSNSQRWESHWIEVKCPTNSWGPSLSGITLIWRHDWSSQLFTQLKEWKILKPECDSNPWPLWYWSSALPTEPSSQLGACHIVSSDDNIPVKNPIEYMKDYIFELQRKIWRYEWSSHFLHTTY